MRDSKIAIIAIALASMQTACSVFTPPSKMERINGPGTYWLDYSSDRRGAIVLSTTGETNTHSFKVCAEPAPDTSSNFELQGTLKRESFGEATTQAGQSVIILPGRNSNVLSLRESLYRLCELSVNRPDIPPSDIMNAYRDVIIAITQFVERDAANSAATTQSAIKAITPIRPVSTAFDAAKEAEQKGFESIATGDSRLPKHSSQKPKKCTQGITTSTKFEMLSDNLLLMAT